MTLLYSPLARRDLDEIRDYLQLLGVLEDWEGERPREPPSAFIAFAAGRLGD